MVTESVALLSAFGFSFLNPRLGCSQLGLCMDQLYCLDSAKAAAEMSLLERGGDVLLTCIPPKAAPSPCQKNREVL